MFCRLFILGFLILSRTMFSHDGSYEKNELYTKILNTPPLAWAHEQAGITYDEALLKFGHLKNGMRFALGASDTDECEFLLLVAVGSLAEEPHEFGMAHLIEHLSLRANKWGEETIYDAFIKGRYGASNVTINGDTTTGMTMYSVKMKQCKDKVHAIKTLADIAYRSHFSPDDLQKEKRIVDAEEMRNFYGELLQENQKTVVYFQQSRNFFRRVWPHANIADPMGVKRVRDTFDSIAVNKFYKKWYDPRRMVFTFIGKAEEHAEVSALFEKEFADFYNDNDLSPMTPHDFLLDSDHVVSIIDNIKLPYNHEIFIGDVSFPYLAPRLDKEFKKEELVYLVVRHILEQAIWKNAAKNRSWNTKLILRPTKESQLSLSLNIKLPHGMANSDDINRIFSTINRYEARGFSEEEIKQAKFFVKKQFDENNQVLSKSIKNLKDALLGSFTHTDVKLSKDPTWLTDELDKIDAAKCKDAFNRAWKKWPREGRIMMTSDRLTSDKLEQRRNMLATLDRFFVVENDVPETLQNKLNPFIGDKKISAGDDVSMKIKKTSDGRRAFFLNGDLQVWSIPQEKNDRIRVLLALGDVGLAGSTIIENAELAALSLAGFKEFSHSDIRSLFPQIQVNFLPLASGLLVMGSGPKEDLGKIFELMHAFITEPNFSEIENPDLRDSILQVVDRFPLASTSHLGEFIAELAPVIYVNHENRGGAQFLDARLNRNHLSKRLNQLRKIGITKLGFVGINDLPEAITLFSETFSDIKWSYSPPLKPLTLKTNVSSIAQCLDGDCPTARVMVMYPIGEKIAKNQHSLHEALAFFLEKELFEEIRVIFGEGYQPQVRIMDSNGIINDFYLIDVDVTIENAEYVASLIKKIASTLSTKIDSIQCQLAEQQKESRYRFEEDPVGPFLLDGCIDKSKKDSQPSMVTSLEIFRDMANRYFLIEHASSKILLPKKQ